MYILYVTKVSTVNVYFLILCSVLILEIKQKYHGSLNVTVNNSTNYQKKDLTTPHLKLLNTNTTYWDGNQDPGMGQTQQRGSVKSVNGISTPSKHLT